MKKYQIISISSRSMTPAQTEEHHRELIKLANDPQVPWWQNNPTAPSTRYVLDTFAAEEVGVPDPYGKEKQRFKLWRVDGDKNICLDEGIIEQEKILVNRSHEDRRQFWIKGQKLVSFFIETTMEGDDTPQFIIASGFKKTMDSFRAMHRC
jgi:hypothetical protein